MVLGLGPVFLVIRRFPCGAEEVHFALVVRLMVESTEIVQSILPLAAALTSNAAWIQSIDWSRKGLQGMNSLESLRVDRAAAALCGSAIHHPASVSSGGRCRRAEVLAQLARCDAAKNGTLAKGRSCHVGRPMETTGDFTYCEQSRDD